MKPSAWTNTRSRLARTLCATALAATAGLLLAACGSSNAPSASSSSPTPSPSPSPKLITSVDACTLVTAADASTAAGTTVTSLSAASVPGACFYSSSDGTTSVIVFAQTYPDMTTAQNVSPQQIAAAINVGAAGAANAKPVSGIGDKAIEYSGTTSGANGTVIFVFKANVVLMIAMTPTPASTAIEQLAKTAVGRL